MKPESEKKPHGRQYTCAPYLSTEQQPKHQHIRPILSYIESEEISSNPILRVLVPSTTLFKPCVGFLGAALGHQRTPSLPC